MFLQVINYKLKSFHKTKPLQKLHLNKILQNSIKNKTQKENVLAVEYVITKANPTKGNSN